MAIKVLIRRKFKEGSLEKASRLLIRARYGAMGMKGYISSETLSVYNDPTQVIVISMLQTIADWRRWVDSPQRSEFSVEMNNILEEPEHSEIYMLGMEQGF